MKKLFWKALLAICIVLAVHGAGFADQYYKIKNYDVKIDVAENNTYAVNETIHVYFTEARHGVFRKIPLRQYGYSHKISDIRVYDPSSGYSYPYEVSHSGSELQIKIGDPNAYVAGDQFYRIEYVYDASADRISAYDEFYFNLIGTDWDATIDQVSFMVRMPKTFDADKANVTAGSLGSTASTDVEWEVNGLTISGMASDLQPYQGVTMAIELPEGYYQNVSQPVNLLWIFILYGVLIAVFIGIILMRNRNYNSSRIVPVLSFYPPDELNPAELAYAYGEEQLANESIASLIVYWASKGFLRIVEEEKPGLFGNREEIYFEQLADASQVPSGYERSLFLDLFAYGVGGIVRVDDLKNKFYEDLNAARELIRDQYRDDREILENRTQYGVVGMGFLVFAISVFLLAPYTQVLLGLPFWGAMLPTGIGLLILWLIPYAIASRRSGKRIKRGAAIFRMVFLVFLFGQMSFVFRFLFQDIDWGNLSFSSLLLYPLIAIVLYMMVMFSLGKVKRYTPFAQDLLNRTYGFKNFLQTAKLDRLHMLFDENPTYFYDMLPYAMIFGITEIWDDYMQMMSLQGPDWYVSHRPFRAHYMMNTVNHSFTQMSAAPQSSSSGGGSVGGGGGGGGGGSW